jgi:glycosyltransferase involved in cell wall biosynthesis
MVAALDVPAERVHVIGAGFRQDVFAREDRTPARRVVYAGKLSDAKGVAPLLDAMARIGDAELHVAGDGEAELRERVSSQARVTWHGMLSPQDLAALLNTASVFVLPSFYEGLPLVIVEALACGCRVVATALEGVTAAIAPHVGDALTTVALPRMAAIDEPVREDLPAFVDRLEAALRAALDAPPIGAVDLSAFTWKAVFGRVEAVWRAL